MSIIDVMFVAAYIHQIIRIYSTGYYFIVIQINSEHRFIVDIGSENGLVRLITKPIKF